MSRSPPRPKNKGKFEVVKTSQQRNHPVVPQSITLKRPEVPGDEQDDQNKNHNMSGDSSVLLPKLKDGYDSPYG